MTSRHSLWFRTPSFDLAFFHIPVWLCWCAVLFVLPSSVLQAPVPIWGWVCIVLFVDVGHVWATLYRTYWDTESRQRNSDILFRIPFLCFVGAFGLAWFSVDLFWRVLAYIALYHFIKQQYGITALYHTRLFRQARQLPEAAKRPLQLSLQRLRRWDKIAIYVATGFPVLWWHLALPRKISWFSQGDFLFWFRELHHWLQTLLAPELLFALRSSWTMVWCGTALLWVGLHWHHARRFSLSFPWGKAFWVLGTYFNWYLGIVWIDSPFAFTLTNVIAHGIPYYGLVYLYTESSWKENTPRWPSFFLRRTFLLGLFFVPLFFFAFWEEYLWDLFVHGKEHSLFFQCFVSYPISKVTHPVWLAFWIALLSLPQATHYFLDGFLWKSNDRNPHLKKYLQL